LDDEQRKTLVGYLLPYTGMNATSTKPKNEPPECYRPFYSKEELLLIRPHIESGISLEAFLSLPSSVLSLNEAINASPNAAYEIKVNPNHENVAMSGTNIKRCLFYSIEIKSTK